MRFLSGRAASWAVSAFLVCVCLESPLFAAEVKKKDGQVIEGEIRGSIVQKREVMVRKSEDSSKKRYTAVYIMHNGKDIVRINEDGVFSTRIWLVTASQDDTPPDDLEVFTADEKGEMKNGERTLPNGRKMNVLGFDIAPAKSSSGRLLGESRRDKGKDIIVPELHITTKAGVVRIPVEEIVKFKEKAEGSEPKKQ